MTDKFTQTDVNKSRYIKTASDLIEGISEIDKITAALPSGRGLIISDEDPNDSYVSLYLNEFMKYTTGYNFIFMAERPELISQISDCVTLADNKVRPAMRINTKTVAVLYKDGNTPKDIAYFRCMPLILKNRGLMNITAREHFISSYTVQLKNDPQKLINSMRGYLTANFNCPENIMADAEEKFLNGAMDGMALIEFFDEKRMAYLKEANPELFADGKGDSAFNFMVRHQVFILYKHRQNMERVYAQADTGRLYADSFLNAMGEHL